MTRMTDQSVFQSVTDRDATYSPEMDAVVADMMERFAGLLVEA